MLAVLRRGLRTVGLLAAISMPSMAVAGVVEETFSRHTKGSSAVVDTTDWASMLKTYLVAGPDRLNTVRYATWKAEAHARLKTAIAGFERVDVEKLDRPDQFAFWANLYNAKTIDIILDHYPVKSIKDIRLGGTLLANVTGGPWKAKVVTVSGHPLSLDDIEHVILRGLFGDARVHYAVNCASVGCPNLRQEPYSGAALEAQLDQAARDYVNASRGIRVTRGKVTASSIYNWFQVDFGGTVAGVLRHVRKYAEPNLVAALATVTAIDEYAYDWSLNDANR